MCNKPKFTRVFQKRFPSSFAFLRGIFFSWLAHFYALALPPKLTLIALFMDIDDKMSSSTATTKIFDSCCQNELTLYERILLA